jgi:hypothetical protein
MTEPTREQVIADLQELDDSALKQALLAGQQASGRSDQQHELRPAQAPGNLSKRGNDGPSEYDPAMFGGKIGPHKPASVQYREGTGKGGGYE